MGEVDVLNNMIRKIYRGEEPPYYYSDIIEFTKDNLSEIKSKVIKQILDVFKVEDIKSLKSFVNNINEDKSKIEFQEFILRGFIKNQKLFLCVETMKSIE